MNAWAAVNFIENAASAGLLPTAIHESELDANQVETFEIIVPDVRPGELKVTLAWDDYEANQALTLTVPHLVNDIDLLLIDPDGITHYPWTLEPLPVADCGGSRECGDLDPIRPEDVVPASRGPDHLNNVEMVQVENPKAGSWVIVVRAHDLPAPLQSYSLVYSVKKFGKIVVNNDEWTLSDDSFRAQPWSTTDARQFALNVVDWFTGGTSGNFLVYSTPFDYNTGLTGTQLESTMTSAGHSWTIINTTTSFSLDDLLQYDGIFLAGSQVDNSLAPPDTQVLIDYVKAGGNVYLAGGTDPDLPQKEADQWNPFLNACGLEFEAPQNDVYGTLQFDSSHPIFTGVQRLYQRDGNSIREVVPLDPNGDAAILVQSEQGEGLYAVCSLGGPIDEVPTVIAIVEPPTAITLLSFTAEAGADHVTLAWETGTEVDNAGFNLWRGEAADRPYTRLNDAFIPAEGDPVSGASYAYTDTDVVKGVTYYYKLEDVDIYGVSTFHGPVSATLSPIRRIYLPLIFK